jgi:leucyl-tRNA synthetase
MVGEMGGVLDTFALSESIGPEKTAYILKAMLQSGTVTKEIGFSTMEASDSADSISKNAAKKSYAQMLNSLMLTVEMVEAASDINVNTAEAVEKMLNDLTPESAEVLKTITTPEVVKNYGVPEKSSKPTSELMGDTFENLAQAKEDGMSDEDYAKESSAVTNMMSVVMTSGKGAIFGDRSATGTTAQQFVDDIMDSTVMADTIVEKVYAGGDEPVVDPLVSNRTMAQEESDSFIEALNNRWNASAKDEATKKEIISIASIMNVKVEITESGVQKVAN